MSRAMQRVILFAALAALAGALAYFAKIRFASGDLYPAYSTLRTDPLGSKALFESLQRVKNKEVRRNLEPLERQQGGAGTTTVLLGLETWNQYQQEENIQKLARDGATVVVSLDARSSKKGNAPTRFIKTPPPAGKGATNTNVVLRSTWEALGLDLGTLGLLDTNNVEATRVKDDIAAPESIYWYGNIRLIPATNEWETVYEAKGKPVVIQRKLGLGSIVVIADSFLFSNEAMQIAREPEFLLWALGSGQIIFDETHLGIQRGSGIAVMMREFRLQGLAIGCLLLVGLWVWRNTTPFVPPIEIEKTADATIEGKTAREGIVHLLRRNLNDIDVLRSGVEEWVKSHPPKEYWQTVRVNEARKFVEAYAAAPTPRNLAGAQRELSKILFPKR